MATVATLQEFTRHVGPLVSNATHVKTLVSCMNVIMSVSTLPVEVMQEFEQQYGNGSLQDIRGDARKKYDEYYAQEQELNEQLNTFATNFSTVYGGANTVRAQIGYPSNKEYTELEGPSLGSRVPGTHALFCIPPPRQDTRRTV
ncbi:hypothetical protein LSAT2_013121 [Lamellibrachia satsuma]|nr:hypothetical protein LSAT2_013121 [Lamellibrachia satsuma]